MWADARCLEAFDRFFFVPALSFVLETWSDMGLHLPSTAADQHLIGAGDHRQAVRRDVSALDFADATRRTGMGVGEQPTCRNAQFTRQVAHLINSATRIRTWVARVRAEYPNQLDYSGFCWT